MTKRIQVVGVVAAVGIALILGAAWAQKQAGGPKIPKPPPTAFMSNFYTRTISGKVTRLDGTPAANIPVHARFRRNMTGAEGENKDVTDAQGRYAMRVSAEEFVVMVDNGGTSYLSESHLADVRTKSATDINLTLHLTPRVTVRVRDALTGQPVEGIKIVRFGKADAQTSKDGTFTFRMLGFEEHLELRPEGSNLTAAPGYSFYRSLMVGSQSGTRRDPYMLEPDTDVMWDVRTYRNEPGAEQTTFRGIVTGPDGKPAAGAGIDVTRYYSDEMKTVSDAAGRWSFSARRINDLEAMNRNIVVRVHYGNLVGFAFPTAEETWGGIPVRLRPRPTAALTGIVVDAQGHPISHLPVSSSGAFFPVPNGSPAYGDGSVVNTNASGRFTLDGLWPQARYTLYVGGRDPSPLPGVIYGQTRLPVGSRYPFEGYQISEGEQHDIGRIVLPRADGVIAGRVVDKRGRPSPQMLVEVRGKFTQSQADTTDADGRFSVKNLVHEPLTLGVYPWVNRVVGSGEGAPYLLFMHSVPVGETNMKLVIADALITPAKPSAKP